MYKLIIVDDEPATRQGIKSAVNWEMLDIEIVGEATNGAEGLELFRRMSPDIIICDIRMPKMDGISMINEVQSEKQNVQVLFLSGYSDKEYLKKAIKLEAVDYIYKPFELSELIAAIEKAKQKCSKTSEKNSTFNDIALELLEYGKSSSALSLPVNRLDVDVNAPMLSILVRLNLSKKSFLLQTELGSEILDTKMLAKQYFNAFKRAFGEIFDGKYVISCVNNGYIVHANVLKTCLYDSITVNKLNRLFSLVGDLSDDCFTVGIGNVADSARELKEAYSQARAAAVSSFLLGYGKVILYRDLSARPFEASHDIQEQFYEKIGDGNIASAIDFLDDYIEYMRGCRWQDISKIKDELASIAFWLNRRSKENMQFSQSYVTELLNSTLDIMDIKKYLMQLLEQILDDLHNLDNKGRTIFEVEHYIIDHLDGDLSIKAIAESVYITPTYLCFLYKKNTGKTINQFILEVKMKKAKKLVTETNLRLGEIAERLGFANQNYFTRTFTGYYGVNPSTFRNKSL